VIDVRHPHEWEAGRIVGSVHLPLAQLAGRLGEVNRERAIVTVCRGGPRSAQAAALAELAACRRRSTIWSSLPRTRPTGGGSSRPSTTARPETSLHARSSTARRASCASVTGRARRTSLAPSAFLSTSSLLWNTRYIEAALDHLRATGFDVREEDVQRLTPLIWGTSNCTGGTRSPKTSCRPAHSGLCGTNSARAARPVIQSIFRSVVYSDPETSAFRATQARRGTRRHVNRAAKRQPAAPIVAVGAWPPSARVRSVGSVAS
jgi:hypothetical protein